MFLYNVTVTIDREVADDWLQWMRQTHIPEVMATGIFSGYRMGRLLDHEHTEAEIFTVQYEVPSLGELSRYQKEFAPELQRRHRERYDGKFAAFRTVMEIVV